MALLIDKIRRFWGDNEAKIVLLIGLLLVAAISFESGYLKGKSGPDSPLVVEMPVVAQNSDSGEASGSVLGAQKAAQAAKTEAIGSQTPAPSLPAEKQDCAFVGSKNSDKFHTPNCRFAKLIKPANLVCFKTAEEALGQGRVGDKGCIK